MRGWLTRKGVAYKKWGGLHDGGGLQEGGVAYKSEYGTVYFEYLVSSEYGIIFSRSDALYSQQTVADLYGYSNWGANASSTTTTNHNDVTAFSQSHASSTRQKHLLPQQQQQQQAPAAFERQNNSSVTSSYFASPSGASLGNHGVSNGAMTSAVHDKFKNKYPVSTVLPQKISCLVPL